MKTSSFNGIFAIFCLTGTLSAQSLFPNPDFETGKVKLTPFTWDSDPESQKRIPGTDVLHKELSFTIDLDTIPKWAGDDKERLLREMDE